MSDLETAVFSEQVLRECLHLFPHVVFAVTGHCMSPDLDEGQRVRLVSTARRPPRLGDVVLTRTGDRLRLHRLVWPPPFVPKTTGWRTQADRASFLDPTLARDAVLGTVVEVEGRRYERRPARALLSLARAGLARLRSRSRWPR